MLDDDNIVNEALLYMRALIKEGWEYPHAEYKAARKFGVSADVLCAAYDNS